MCIAVPVEVTAVQGQQAVVERKGVEKKINIDLVPEVTAGDYVLLHSGCAVKKINQAAAEKTLSLFADWSEEMEEQNEF